MKIKKYVCPKCNEKMIYYYVESWLSVIRYYECSECQYRDLVSSKPKFK